MSGRTKKAQSTPASKSSAAQSAVTPAASAKETSSPMKSGARDRPPSPTMISRIQEKNELASLNDRLAVYIERVRQLETENSRLSRIVHSHEETVTKEVTGIKGLYEGELASARKLLDDIAKEKAKLQFENGKLKADLDDTREKLRGKEKDAATYESRLLSAESQVSELQARLNDAVNQRRHFEDEYNKIKKELDGVNKTLASVKKHLEDETIHRVDLENRLQSLKEELNFKTQIHQQELNETVSRSRVVVEEVDGRLQQEYDCRLKDALVDMREENEEQLRKMREETEALFARKLNELTDLANRSTSSSDKAQSELRSARKRVDELSSEVSKLNAQNQSYEARIRDLENQLKREQSDHAAQIDALNAEIRRLHAQIEDQLVEYRDLMDIKIQLATEIAAYRKLLESEETRLNLSTTDGTPGRTPGGLLEPSRKRKRVEAAGSSSLLGQSVVRESQSTSDYSVKNAAKDVIEVQEVDVGGKFVKIFNTSAEKDMAIGGWQLKQSAGDQERTYKFNRNVHLKAQQSLTVWSSDTDQTASASNLIMKDQAWATGDEIKVTLLDTKGEELASQEKKKSALRTSSLFVRSGDESTSQTQSARKSWGWSLFGNFLM